MSKQEHDPLDTTSENYFIRQDFAENPARKYRGKNLTPAGEKMEKISLALAGLLIIAALTLYAYQIRNDANNPKPLPDRPYQSMPNTYNPTAPEIIPAEEKNK